MLVISIVLFLVIYLAFCMLVGELHMIHGSSAKLSPMGNFLRVITLPGIWVVVGLITFYEKLTKTNKLP